MQTVSVKLKKAVDTSYTITVGSGLLPRLPDILRKDHLASAYVIIADTTTARLFGTSLHAKLLAAGAKSLLLTVPAGERAKEQTHKTRLEETMLRKGIDRKALVVALGGGVVGDLAGFVAATYMRGIPYIQVPTTLLAMVDSSIGGKTGINTPQGKNLIGAFHQPKAVYADMDTLKGLPERELACGLVEAVKMFMTSDAASWKHAKRHLDRALRRDSGLLSEVIARAAKVKARVVASDERESGERAVLNFGHTVGHALEKLSAFTLLHGEAVGLGMLVEGELAKQRGALSARDYDDMRSVLGKLGIDASALRRFSPERIVRAAKGDKKSAGGHVRYVIVSGIGSVEERDGRFVFPVSDAEVIRAVKDVTV